MKGWVIKNDLDSRTNYYKLWAFLFLDMNRSNIKLYCE